MADKRTIGFARPLYEALGERAKELQVSCASLARAYLQQGVATVSDDGPVRALLMSASVQLPIAANCTLPVDEDLVQDVTRIASRWSTQRSVRTGHVIAALLWNQLHLVHLPAPALPYEQPRQEQSYITMLVSRSLNAVLLDVAQRQRCARDALVARWLMEQLAAQLTRIHMHESMDLTSTLLIGRQETTSIRLPRAIDQLLRTETLRWRNATATSLVKSDVAEFLLWDAWCAADIPHTITIPSHVFHVLLQRCQQENMSLPERVRRALLPEIS